MIKKMLAAMILLVSILPLLPAHAADMLIPNYSFDSGLTSWTQTHGSGGIAVSSEQARTGTNSVKIVDNSTTASYGLQSAYMPAIAGKSYYTYAWANIQSGYADLYLRFYDSSHTLLSSAFVSKNSPANQWFSIRTGAVAPAGTAYVAVLLYSSGGGMGTTYWDDILITADLTNIGSVVTSTAMRSATLALDGNGKPAFYLGLNGSSNTRANMVEVNVNTGAIQKQMSLPGATFAHSAATTVDNKVYMGTYPNGYLFSYTPGAASPVNLGRAISDATYIYALAPGSTPGKVYGGTFPNSGVFKYEPSSAFYTFSPKPFFAGSNYTYGIAYDAPRNVLYAGNGGVTAQISRLENSGGLRHDNLLPTAIANANTAVDKLNFEGDKVFARVNPEYKEVVLDVKKNADGSLTTTLDAEFPAHSYGVSPILNGKVYYSYQGLRTYDVNTKTTAAAQNPDGSPVALSNGYAWGIATLDDQVNYPGETIVGVAHGGGTIVLFKYNPTSKKSSSMLLTGLPGVPVDISSLGSAGPDKKIFAGGYLSGNMGEYTPMRSDLNKMNYGIAQAEGMTSIGNMLYVGGYPNAKIYKNDVSQPWAPSLVVDIGATDLQERPFGMAQGDNKVFIGTVAASGQLEGALTIHDTITGTTQIFRNIVPNQSIVSVAYYNGYVYAGSTIGGGKDTTPKATEAKLVKMNVATGAYTTYSMPVSSQGITALALGPDNKIWGLSEGYVFAFNPTTNAFDYHVQSFTDVTYGTGSQITQDGSLVQGRPGSNLIFGTIKNHFFKIDTSTNTVTNIYNGVNNFRNATSDGYGNIYFKMNNDLFRWAYDSVDPTVTGIELDRTELLLTDREQETKLMARVLPDTAWNRNVRWTSANPDVASVNEDGTVTAVSDGRTTVTAVTEEGGYTATAAVTVDMTAPQITFSGPTRAWHSDTVTMNVYADDIISGVSSLSVTLDGLPHDATFTISPLELAVGDHIIRAVAVDRAGNESVREFLLVIDIDSTHLLEVLKEGAQKGWINKEGILQSLSAKLQHAVEVQNDPEKLENALKAFENQLKAQDGKAIDTSFVQILLQDVNYILNKLFSQ